MVTNVEKWVPRPINNRLDDPPHTFQASTVNRVTNRGWVAILILSQKNAEVALDWKIFLHIFPDDNEIKKILEKKYFW